MVPVAEVTDFHTWRISVDGLPIWEKEDSGGDAEAESESP